jgi:pyridoxamine 5'-phosphate oxidase
MRRWIATAVEARVREPLSLALATADDRGRASNRIVTVTAVTGEGLVFATHATSQKGREVAATGRACGLFYWRETAQQLIVSGPVVLLPVAGSEAIWQARAGELDAMSVASRQSDRLANAASLRAEAQRLAAHGARLARPDRFVGYRLEPDTVEFWCASSDRLHRRLRYDRAGAAWRISRLQP